MKSKVRARIASLQYYSSGDRKWKVQLQLHVIVHPKKSNVQRFVKECWFSFHWLCQLEVWTNIYIWSLIWILQLLSSLGYSRLTPIIWSQNENVTTQRRLFFGLCNSGEASFCLLFASFRPNISGPPISQETTVLKQQRTLKIL